MQPQRQLKAFYDYLEGFDYGKNMIFLPKDLKTYYAVKCFLVMRNIPYKDEFLNEAQVFEILNDAYKDDPSDKNFLSALSSSVCEQRERFIEIEKHFSFPKKPFDHFKLTERKLSNELQPYTVLLAKDDERFNQMEVYRISLSF
ncbi:MAG: hypothetical protein H6850_00020 [Alphaproteobacteria bacterium]|nr:MAG: hypothetical protein H6850_00020 [Alphaproteobacteria bacterium]